MKLVIIHADGILRSATTAIHTGLTKGFSAIDLPFRYSEKDIRTVRGFEKFHAMETCIKVFYALTKQGMRFANVDPKLMERQLDTLVSMGIREYDTESLQKIATTFNEFLQSEQAAPLFSITPNVQPVFQQLAAAGIKLAVWTGNALGSIQEDMTKLGDVFAATSDKPLPDALPALCSQLGVPLEEAVYVGHTVADIRAAQAASCKCVILLNAAGDERIVRQAEADAYEVDLPTFANTLAPPVEDETPPSAVAETTEPPAKLV
ncbi:MAG: HAD hydrolase-like protein [Nanoarchaeota archaeon]|nr:HAD hydrolase-like protein [Nanoarchaeota archaeon]